MLPARLLATLEGLDAHDAALAASLEDPAVAGDHRRCTAIARERAQLAPVLGAYRDWRRVRAERDDAAQIAAEETDAELVALARSELPALDARLEALGAEMARRLVRADDEAYGALVLEIRAGVGGDEASIWAGDLLEMYRRFAEIHRWSFEVLDDAPGDAGGFKHVVASVRGDGAWQSLGYEGGTHQVKRVPATEAQGRVHTSTATVAVLPEPEEVDVKVDPGEVREIVTTAQGPGGQNVNKVSTAVQLVHEPTGIIVRVQETRSQQQNRERAWRLLRARLLERRQAESDAARTAQRNRMIGTGSRAEKIRTYRWKENMVVDHRTSRSYNLGAVMAGQLDDVVRDLSDLDTAQRMEAMT